MSDQKIKLLCVEDKDGWKNIVKAVLEKYWPEIDPVFVFDFNGAVAVLETLPKKIDIMLTDMEFKDASGSFSELAGFKLLQRVKNKHSTIKSIAMSNDIPPGARDFCMKNNIPMIEKSVEEFFVDELNNAIRQTLDIVRKILRVTAPDAVPK